MKIQNLIWSSCLQMLPGAKWPSTSRGSSSRSSEGLNTLPEDKSLKFPPSRPIDYYFCCSLNKSFPNLTCISLFFVTCTFSWLRDNCAVTFSLAVSTHKCMLGAKNWEEILVFYLCELDPNFVEQEPLAIFHNPRKTFSRRKVNTVEESEKWH